MAEALRRYDVINVRPAFVKADADALNARFAGIDALTMLRTLFAEGTLGSTAVVSSFGTESAVLLDLVARADPTTPVIFVDTLKMFPETLAYRDRLVAHVGLRDSRVVAPDLAVLLVRDEQGLRWSYDPDGCCDVRKVEPLARAKQGLDSWISGRKAFQSQTRQNIPRFEVEDGRLKVNPLGDWVKADLQAYFDASDLPRHPLESDGYLSIGCQPCTSKVQPGEDPRAGRWRGWAKVECGIHGGILDPLIEFYRPLPPLAYLPLMIIWFGIGEVSKVLLIVLACFAPVALATRSGVLSASADQINAARALGASRAQVLRYVVLPAALPEILIGLRIGMGVGWTTLVAAEMVAAQAGLGQLVLNASNFLRTDVVVMGILLIGLFATVFEVGLRRLERVLVPWKGKA